MKNSTFSSNKEFRSYGITLTRECVCNDVVVPDAALFTFILTCYVGAEFKKAIV